jgi:hypothetical protein
MISPYDEKEQEWLILTPLTVGEDETVFDALERAEREGTAIRLIDADNVPKL